MNIAQVKKQFSDKLSICLSLCCILHCIALPVIILMIPSFASLWINNEKVHVILVFVEYEWKWKAFLLYFSSAFILNTKKIKAI